jgi:hypothetical protein
MLSSKFIVSPTFAASPTFVGECSFGFGVKCSQACDLVDSMDFADDSNGVE